MIRALTVHFSQTGQLTRLLDSFVAPLREDPSFEMDTLELTPIRPYPFPWPLFAFFEAMPESVLMRPPRLAPFEIDATTKYDIVILAYQPWFLSPSPPMTAFLKSHLAATLLNNTPVITLIGCRNAWVLAQEAIRGLLLSRGATLIDNAAFTDNHGALLSMLTTPRWMFTGKRRGWPGMNSSAGISQASIDGAARFGVAIRDGLKTQSFTGHDSLLQGLGAVDVNPKLVGAEQFAKRIFLSWCGPILRAGPPGSAGRRLMLLCFVLFFVTTVILLLPVSLLLKTLFTPILEKRWARMKLRYEQPSGSGRYAMGATGRNHRTTPRQDQG